MKRILVLDDERNIRTSICAYLDDCGYQTLSCESAENAVKLLQSDKIDLAIVDLRLPKMDGEMFILKAKELLPDLPIIIYTGSIGYSVPPALQAKGVSQKDVIFKPAPHLSVITNMIEDKLTKD